MLRQPMQLMNYKQGDVIFSQGDFEKVLYKIIGGTVGIYANHGQEEEIQLSLLKNGQCFGEMSILEDCPRSATAVAETDVTLAAYPESLMSNFIHQNPLFALELMRNLSARLRNSTDELEKMHSMLIEVTEQKAASKEIKQYIERHTTYAPDGTMQFCLRI